MMANMTLDQTNMTNKNRQLLRLLGVFFDVTVRLVIRNAKGLRKTIFSAQLNLACSTR
jgi:hypothetical protein